MCISVGQAFERNTHHHDYMAKSNFGEVLSGLMIERSITSKTLANSIGVTSSTVNTWRNNEHGIQLPNLVSLCQYFNCSLDYLAGMIENDIKPSKITLLDFGKRVREVMKSKGISTYTLRKETQFTSRNFHDWDKGSAPKLSTLIDLANYFKCSLDELVGFE